MTDDQQRARELEAVAERNLRSYLIRHVPAGPDRVSALLCIDTLAALRAAPAVTDDAVERAAKSLHANGADSITSDTPWSELHDGEVNQFRSWARAALVAARPQGVKDV